jgi:hypothetical protein
MTKFLPYLVAPIYWLLSRTWRIRVIGPADVLSRHVQGPVLQPCIFAHWHGDELAMVGCYTFRRLAVLSSLSRDGSLMARTLELLGYQVFRGSSSRGGARGLIGLIRAVKKGSQGALAVDGPRGPIHEVKPGIVELAVKTEGTIIPVRTRCDRAWHFPRAWNRPYLPKPFARVEVEYGEVIQVDPDKDSPSLCLEVKAGLDRIPEQVRSGGG